MTTFSKRLLFAGGATIVVVLVVLALLLWLQPWRPDWHTVEANTKDHLQQAGYVNTRISSDDFRWRYNVRAT